MAQDSYNVVNGSGAAVRTAINNALAAIVSQNSGPSAPSVPFAHMFWPDTTAGKLKQRNGANTAWVILGVLGVLNLGLATLASPSLTGSPTAPTPATSDNTTRLATTAMVQAAAAALIANINTIPVNLDGSITTGRTIFVDTDAPSGGANGDVWFEY